MLVTPCPHHPQPYIPVDPRIFYLLYCKGNITIILLFDVSYTIQTIICRAIHSHPGPRSPRVARVSTLLSACQSRFKWCPSHCHRPQYPSDHLCRTIWRLFQKHLRPGVHSSHLPGWPLVRGLWLRSRATLFMSSPGYPCGRRWRSPQKVCRGDELLSAPTLLCHRPVAHSWSHLGLLLYMAGQKVWLPSRAVISGHLSSRIHRSCAGVKASFKVGLKEGMTHTLPPL